MLDVAEDLFAIQSHKKNKPELYDILLTHQASLVQDKPLASSLKPGKVVLRVLDLCLVPAVGVTEHTATEGHLRSKLRLEHEQFPADQQKEPAVPAAEEGVVQAYTKD